MTSPNPDEDPLFLRLTDRQRPVRPGSHLAALAGLCLSLAAVAFGVPAGWPSPSSLTAVPVPVSPGRRQITFVRKGAFVLAV